jgi:hypothetical protein
MPHRTINRAWIESWGKVNRLTLRLSAPAARNRDLCLAMTIYRDDSLRRQIYDLMITICS